MVDLSQTKAIQQFKELAADVRIVIVHPNYRAQHLLLSQLLQDAQSVYVRFSGEKLSQSQLREQLETALHTQVEQVSLQGVGSLFLDECDRAAPDAFDAFLPQVVSESNSSRVVVVSRVVPQCVLKDENLRASTRFVPSDDPLMLWDYAQRDNETALLEVRTFGTGHVLLDGQVVDNWDGLLPRSLFFYLVDRGMTTRNDIFATFWPDLSVREATNVFHVTKRKISEVLGTDLTVYWSGFYRISPKIYLSYDAIEFSELVQNGLIAPRDEAVSLLRQAISLYRGDFLTSLNADWVKKRRDELLQAYVEALVALARIMESTGQNREALGLNIRAAVNSPQREDLAEHIMRLYRSLGMPADALATYSRLEKELTTSLGISPTASLQELAAAIRSEVNSSSAQ